MDRIRINCTNGSICSTLYSEMKKKKRGRVSSFFEGFTLKPAQTILLSFLIVILIGAGLLMLPLAVKGEAVLSPIDALFTATSAVCVTGLIVVDTATVFSVWGRIILLLLIQIGGLGIMILSYFALFSARQRISLEEKLLLSYMLSEKNMNQLAGRVRSIIFATFLIEGLGALLLLPHFLENMGGGTEALFYALFHAVSAFCNAGFALFTDSLEGMRGSLVVNFTVAGLIIFGGLGFSVLSETGSRLRDRLKGTRTKIPISLNTRIVLMGTGILLLLGTLLFYGLEHEGVLLKLPTGTQYMAAFFQSVTLRTAGFNTVAIGSLATGSLLVMMLFMFIGAAQGSTAGGIKINTVAVIAAYVKSVLSGRKDVILSKYSIAMRHVQKAFLVFLFALSSIFLGVCLLSLFEEELPDAIPTFNAVSAFGTVGLSTGITGALSSAGKAVIIVLMFFGRLGPLTILSAAAKPEKRTGVSYPRGDVSL